MCELEQYASTLRESGGPLSPSRILSNLRNIGCRLGGGTQEDAHEFLRYNCYMLVFAPVAFWLLANVLLTVIIKWLLYDSELTLPNEKFHSILLLD
jgi:hypothetical protein